MPLLQRITLAPVCGVVGLRLNLSDPDNLLKGKGENGFNVALLERHHVVVVVTVIVVVVTVIVIVVVVFVVAVIVVGVTAAISSVCTSGVGISK
jgi:hypothetical protein